MSNQIPRDNAESTELKGKSAEKGDRKDKEIGGFENCLEPTRYGDWEVNGRCSDF